MDLNELFSELFRTIHPFESLGSLILFLLFIAGTFIQISPIKINPWDIALGWIGDRFNSGINKKIDMIDKKTDNMEKRLDEHIAQKKKQDVKAQRNYILGFVNDGVNGARHTKESFDNAVKACDEYEAYIKANNIENGVINSSIRAIRKKYEEHLLKGDFPSEETYINKDKQ